jgi:hypothetical protein
MSAQVSEQIVNRIFVASYWLEAIPHNIVREFDESGVSGEADIFFETPSLNFDVSDASLQNALELQFPITAALDVSSPSLEFTVTANLSVIASLEKRTEYVHGQGDMDFVVVDFTGVNDEHFTLSIVEDIDNKELYESILEYIVKDMLQDETQRLTLSPAMPSSDREGSGVGYFDVRIHNDTGDGDLDLLNILMNQDSVVTTPTPLEPLLLPGYDYALAISSDLINQQITEEINEKFGSLPARLESDNSMILRSIDISLGNGHINVSGRVTKEIDCWPDADIDFSGSVRLRVNRAGELEAYDDDIDVDLPWWIHFLHFLLPIIGSIIVGVLYDVVKDMIGEVLTSESSDIFADMTLFAETIPQTSGRVSQAPSITTHTRSVNVRSDGLILYGNIDIQSNCDRYIGNRNTKEFHLRDCYWVTQMYEGNKVYNMTPDEAIERGYNGCWYCLRIYDTG